MCGAWRARLAVVVGLERKSGWGGEKEVREEMSGRMPLYKAGKGPRGPWTC